MTYLALDLLAARADKTCAIATASSDGAPTAALAFYAPQADGRLLMTTHTSSRKWAHLLSNGRVGLVVGWTFAEPHVQLDGNARLVPPGHPEIEALCAAYYAEFPQAAPFRDPTTGVIVITPTWARITHFQPAGPPQVEEGLIELQ